MTHENQTPHDSRIAPTIKGETDDFQTLLANPETRSAAETFFDEASREMVEFASVSDPMKVISSMDLLARNLVIAGQEGGYAATDILTDAPKEVALFGEKVLGETLAEEKDESLQRVLERLQSTLNSHPELPVDTDPADIKQLLEALLFVNGRILLADESHKSALSRNINFRYYVENFVAAKSHLAPQ